MAFELDFIRESITDRVSISSHDIKGAEHTLTTGEWIEVRIGDPANPTVLLQQQVPAGKAWSEIHFQFQAQENPV